jgi:bifunctional DNase/RNase
MKNFMTAFDIQLQEVYISDLQEGIFYSKLVCYTANDTIEIDSRTSDALALAVRFGCPIYVNATVLDKAGNEMDASENDTTENPLGEVTASNNTSDLSTLSMSELTELLNEVLEQEDYIRAIDIRDEIAKRNEQKKS